MPTQRIYEGRAACREVSLWKIARLPPLSRTSWSAQRYTSFLIPDSKGRSRDPAVDGGGGGLPAAPCAFRPPPERHPRVRTAEPSASAGAQTDTSHLLGWGRSGWGAAAQRPRLLPPSLPQADGSPRSPPGIYSPATRRSPPQREEAGSLAGRIRPARRFPPWPLGVGHVHGLPE